MSKKLKTKPDRGGPAPAPPRKRNVLLAWIAAAVVVAGATAALLAQKNHSTGSQSKETTSATNQSNKVPPAPAEPPTMAINTAVMVTVELDFGPTIPTIAEALREVERRSKPDDGYGRTFAILDAYGEPTPDHKLHISMHVSSEKPCIGALVFRRTGEMLWQSRIVTTNGQPPTFTGKNLLILIDNGEGKTFTVDGSANPASILDATIKEMQIPVRLFWPDGAVREVTCIYSACGCPVKAMVKREGERTVRTKDLPVMFPDDPAVVTIISRLMQWQ